MVREHSRGHCPSERPRNFPFSRLLRVLQNEMKCKFNSLAVQTKVRKIWSAIRHVAWQLQEVWHNTQKLQQPIRAQDLRAAGGSLCSDWTDSSSVCAYQQAWWGRTGWHHKVLTNEWMNEWWWAEEQMSMSKCNGFEWGSETGECGSETGVCVEVRKVSLCVPVGCRGSVFCWTPQWSPKRSSCGSEQTSVTHKEV